MTPEYVMAVRWTDQDRTHDVVGIYYGGTQIDVFHHNPKVAMEDTVFLALQGDLEPETTIGVWEAITRRGKGIVTPRSVWHQIDEALGEAGCTIEEEE